MWTTQPYCTLADVKTLIDPTLGTQDDAFLNQLIIEAQADIDAELGYSFQQDGTQSNPATRYYDGTGALELWIPDGLVSLTQVLETIKITYMGANNAWVPGNTQTIDITADIILKPNNFTSLGIPATHMVRNSGYEFHEGVQNYQVLGVFGRPILPNQTYPGVPNDISHACARLVAQWYKMRDTNYADLVQEQGNVRIHYNKDWPADVLRIVNRYRRHLFLTR
jgi:hypothetical protein